MRARPGQAYPYLDPSIPTPRHPSYPSGHAMQAFMISRMISDAVPAMAKPLTALAENIAVNRERARVHFPSDTAASRGKVDAVYAALLTLKDFTDLKALVSQEFAGGVEIGVVP